VELEILVMRYKNDSVRIAMYSVEMEALRCAQGVRMLVEQEGKSVRK
jgi:hypothetical protein